jgi:hypothetical protein
MRHFPTARLRRPPRHDPAPGDRSIHCSPPEYFKAGAFGGWQSSQIGTSYLFNAYKQRDRLMSTGRCPLLGKVKAWMPTSVGMTKRVGLASMAKRHRRLRRHDEATVAGMSRRDGRASAGMTKLPLWHAEPAGRRTSRLISSRTSLDSNAPNRYCGSVARSQYGAMPH